MQLFIVTEKEKTGYNHFVAAQESGSFLQSWEWGEWQMSLGRQVYRFWIIDDNNYNDNRIGLIQLIKMFLPLGKYYLYAPYGPVTDLRFKIEDLRILTAEIQKKIPGAIFIRVEPKFVFQISNQQSAITKSVNIQPGRTLVLDLQKSEAELLSAMHPKTRYNIKVAERHGCQIQDEFAITAGHGLYFEEAVNLLVETGKRQGFTNYPKDYFEKMVDYFALHPHTKRVGGLNLLGEDKKNLTQAEKEFKRSSFGVGVNHQSSLKLHIYKAIYQNKLLASAIYIDFGHAGRDLNPAGRGGTRTFLFGGSSENDRNVMAPYLLHWQAMLDAKAAGLSVYDFWGTETSKGEVPGFVRFKLGFAPRLSSGSASGTEKIYAGAYDFVIQPWQYGLYKAARRVYRMLRSPNFYRREA
jgi:lipid II:glycine glycyltransferase (peptidoglycan interpeptide bridge formation enzyme)